MARFSLEGKLALFCAALVAAAAAIVALSVWFFEDLRVGVGLALLLLVPLAAILSRRFASRNASSTQAIRCSQVQVPPSTGETASSITCGGALSGCADFDGDGANDRLWLESDALRVVTASGEQVVALDPASPWRLLKSCR